MQHLFLLFSNAYLYKVHLPPAIFKSGRPFETSLSRDGYCIYFAFVFPLQAQHFDNLRNPHSCKSNRPHPYQRRSVILSFGRFSRFSNRLAFQHLKISSNIFPHKETANNLTVRENLPVSPFAAFDGNVILMELFLYANNDPLDAVIHQEHQQDHRTGSARIIALKAVGDDAVHTAGAYRTQNGALGEVGLQTHSGPGHNLGQSCGQHRVDKDERRQPPTLQWFRPVCSRSSGQRIW